MKYQPAASAEFPNDNTELHEGALWVRPGVIGRAKPLIRPKTLALPSTLPEPLVGDDGEIDSFERDAPEPEAELEIDIDIDVDLEPAELPRAEVVEPRAEAVEPRAEAVEPRAEAVEPRAEAVEPRAEAVEPRAEAVEPRAEAVEPRAEAVEPRAEAVEPRAEAVEPRAEAVEPRAEVVEPRAACPASDGFAPFVAATVRIALDAGATRAAAALPLLLGDADLDDLASDATLCDRLIAAGLAERAGKRLRASAAFAAVAAAWRAVLRGESDDLAACEDSMLDDWAADLLATLLDAPDSRRRELKRELRRSGVAAFGMISVAA